MRSLPAALLLASLSAGAPAAIAGDAVGAAGAAAAAAPGGPELFPLEDVREGMIGVGRTVFQGGELEEFEVEVLGVLRNSSPRRNTILARLRGGPLAQSGVIAGMSGSPVYVGGRLLGAVSSGYLFSKEPIAGITPIQEMLAIPSRDWAPSDSRSLYLDAGGGGDVAPGTALERALAAIERGEVVSPLRRLAAASDAMAGGPAAAAAPGSPIVPVVLSGFEPRAFAAAAPFFRGQGLLPVEAAGALASAPAGSGASAREGDAADLVPGGPVAIELVRGDLQIAAFGTVTSRRGDEVLAFGHPLFNAGTVRFPMATSRVVTVLPSVLSSFKISTVGKTVGALEQDRSTGILGRIGAEARMIPVHLGIQRGRNPLEAYNFEVATHRQLTPVLLELSVLNTLLAAEKVVGPAAISLDGRIRVAGSEPIRIDHFFSGDQAAPTAAGMVAAIAEVLLGNDFSSATIEDITLTAGYLEDNRLATIERVLADRTRVRAGDTVHVKAFVRHARGGEDVVELAVRVPPGVTSGTLELTVGDAASLARFEARSQRYQPRTLPQLVDLINRLRKGSEVYALLTRSDVGVTVKGAKLAGLPPSAYALLVGAEGAEGLQPIRRSVLDEAQAPAGFQVNGLRTVKLTVDGSAG